MYRSSIKYRSFQERVNKIPVSSRFSLKFNNIAFSKEKFLFMHYILYHLHSVIICILSSILFLFNFVLHFTFQ